MNKCIFIFLVLSGILFALLSYIGNYAYSDEQIKPKEMKQITGIIERKDCDYNSCFFIINGTRVNGITFRLYEAFSPGEKIAVIIDNNSSYVCAGVDF